IYARVDAGLARPLPPRRGPLGRRGPDRGAHQDGLSGVHPRSVRRPARPGARPRGRHARALAGRRAPGEAERGELAGSSAGGHAGWWRLRDRARDGGVLSDAAAGRSARRYAAALAAHDRLRHAQLHGRSRSARSAMAPRRVLVTGMSGLIGGALRRHLEGKYELSALNRRSIPGVKCHEADIADLGAIAPAFAGIDTVVHLAARTGSSDV